MEDDSMAILNLYAEEIIPLDTLTNLIKFNLRELAPIFERKLVQVIPCCRVNFPGRLPK